MRSTSIWHFIFIFLYQKSDQTRFAYSILQYYSYAHIWLEIWLMKLRYLKPIPDHKKLSWLNVFGSLEWKSDSAWQIESFWVQFITPPFKSLNQSRPELILIHFDFLVLTSLSIDMMHKIELCLCRIDLKFNAMILCQWC